MTTLHRKEVKVGDKVWDVRKGWDIVTRICEYEFHPIYTNRSSYCEDGYLSPSDKFPSAFWQEFGIPTHAFEKPKVMVKKYQVLLECNGDYFTTTNWRNRNFTSKKEFDDDKNSDGCKFISLILESEIEVEE